MNKTDTLVKVKELEWRTCKALGGEQKLVASDCFGNEFARVDLRGQPDVEIEAFKAAALLTET